MVNEVCKVLCSDIDISVRNQYMNGFVFSTHSSDWLLYIYNNSYIDIPLTMGSILYYCNSEPCIFFNFPVHMLYLHDITI